MPENDAVRRGELFSRNYLDRGGMLLKDQPRFRSRLAAYVETNMRKDAASLAAFIKRESGIVVLSSDFNWFFTNVPIDQVLDSITLIWKYLRARHYIPKDSPLAALIRDSSDAQWENWASFVGRAIREQSMAYKLDERCGVHYLVDEEFERNVASALTCLETPRYAGARAAFEQALRYLDARPNDLKASVRSGFEAVEIVARLIDTASRNLNKYQVLNKLKPLAVARASDSIEAVVIGKAFDGMAELLDGLHTYRHGQGVEQAVAPSMTLAVYVLSSCAAILRWLVEIDSSQP